MNQTVHQRNATGMLVALAESGKHVYQGTVLGAMKAERRRKNKAARAAPPRPPDGGPAMKLFTAHDPDAGPAGTDYLIRINDDGTGEFATRPGRDERWVRWSPPLPLRAEAS